MRAHQRITAGFAKDVFDQEVHPRRSLLRVGTLDNLSDMMTKGLKDEARFNEHCGLMGLVNISDYEDRMQTSFDYVPPEIVRGQVAVALGLVKSVIITATRGALHALPFTRELIWQMWSNDETRNQVLSMICSCLRRRGVYV